MNATLLVVDDEAALREGLVDILEAAGYAVASAGTGAEALERLQQTPADLILLDFRLPDGDASHWAAQFQAVQPGVQIILLTGMAAGDLPALDPAAGISAVLTKPINPKDLLNHIEKTICS